MRIARVAGKEKAKKERDRDGVPKSSTVTATSTAPVCGARLSATLKTRHNVCAATIRCRSGIRARAPGYAAGRLQETRARDRHRALSGHPQARDDIRRALASGWA